ncbi:MAG: hypothetical protein H0T04_01230 [Chloroflexi bacterium]|nr:hypothetical protein [Chloroflexota bacterium]
MEIAAQIALILMLSAVPAFAAAWFTKRGGDVLADAFRPMSGQQVALDEAWPRGVQEEEPRPWGAGPTARRPAVSDRSVEAATETDQLPELQRVRRS